MELNSRWYDFSLLPSHIIATILRNLNFQQRLDAGRTCKSWYFASCDPSISRNVYIRVWRKFNYPLAELNRPFGKLILQHVNFNKINNYQEFLKKFGQHINEIEFDLCRISMDQLIMCFAYLTNLSTIKIKPTINTFAYPLNLTTSRNEVAIKTNLNRVKCFGVVLSAPDADGGLLSLMSMMPNLKTIYFSPEEICGQYIFKPLFKYIDVCGEFLNLHELEIGDLLGTPSSKFFQEFGKIRQQLHIQKLTLGIIRTQNPNREYEEDFDEFCKKICNLRELVMFSVGDCELVSICSHMTKLTKLYLWDKGITDIRIIRKLQHLEKLQLNVGAFRVSCNDDWLAQIFPKLENLKELHLNRYFVSGRVFNSICTNCKQMRRLHITNLETNNLQMLFKNLVNLKWLHITFPDVRVYSFRVDFEITNLQLLEVLEISGFAPGMTMQLIERMPNLMVSALEKIRRIKYAQM